MVLEELPGQEAQWPLRKEAGGVERGGSLSEALPKAWSHILPTISCVALCQWCALSELCFPHVGVLQGGSALVLLLKCVLLGGPKSHLIFPQPCRLRVVDPGMD